MSTLKKSGLRIAAAGAAAATLTLAVGAPSFAQNEDPTPEEFVSTPAVEEDAETTATDDATTPAEDESTRTEAETGSEEDLAKEIEEGSAGAADDELYAFAYLDTLVKGANVGSTVTAAPQIYVEGTPAEDRVASLIWFTDTVDFELWLEDWFDFSEVATGHATAIDSWDNCSRVVTGHLACILTDWTPENGKTYEPATPLQYKVEGEVDYQDISVYSAFDLNADDLEFYTDWLEVDLDGPAAFRLGEVADGDIAEDGYFFYGEGWLSFEADIDDLHPNLPGTENPTLPSTGNSSIVLIGSAAAAVLAGAVVFYLLRRRQAAATWE